MEAGEPSLPEWIRHPLHEQHKLVLRSSRTVGPRSQVLQQPLGTEPSLWVNLAVKPTRSGCSVCKKGLEEWEEVYECEEASPGRYPCSVFKVDIACSSIKAWIEFGGHDHKVFFLERVHNRDSSPLKCRSCGEVCDELMFRCVDEDLRSPCGYTYSVHLLCGPLPVTIPYHYAGYDLNLTLTDTLLDGVDPEDSWCDICEQRRDPSQCVYRSEYPPFTATIDCLLPQIVGALKGHHGKVRLRTVRHHIPGLVVPVSTEEKLAEERRRLDAGEGIIVERKFITKAAEVADDIHDIVSFRQMRESVAEEDAKQVEMELDRAWIKLSRVEGTVHTFRFSDEAFELFEEHVAFSGVISSPVESSWLDDQPDFVKVGDHFVVSEFVRLYRQVIEKHRDFAAGSLVNPVVRAFALIPLLQTIHGMLGRQVFETTGDFLCNWQCYLGCFREIGFEVQFALDNLKKVARACYALKLIKVRDEITADLTQQIQQLEGETEEDKPKIEALARKYRRGKQSTFVNQCLGKAPKLQWKSAGEFLGLEPEE